MFKRNQAETTPKVDADPKNSPQPTNASEPSIASAPPSIMEKNSQPGYASPPLGVGNQNVSLSTIRELLEKNLKWSQIIYEQNRKINSKLFWTAFAGWVRLVLILAPIILAFWFLPPLLQGIKSQYGFLLDNNGAAGAPSAANLENFAKMLPLSEQEKAQLQKYLK